MSDETPPEAEDDHLQICLHCRKRAAVRSMRGANLCRACIAKRVRPRYDIEEDPEHIARQVGTHHEHAESERSKRATDRHGQSIKRGAKAEKVAKAKAPPEPVRSGSQLRAEARERNQTEVS